MVHAGRYCTKEESSVRVVIVYLAWYVAYLGVNKFEALVGCCLANTRVNMACEREINRSKGDNIPEQGGELWHISEIERWQPQSFRNR